MVDKQRRHEKKRGRKERCGTGHEQTAGHEIRERERAHEDQKFGDQI